MIYRDSGIIAATVILNEVKNLSNHDCIKVRFFGRKLLQNDNAVVFAYCNKEIPYASGDAALRINDILRMQNMYVCNDPISMSK